MHLSNESLLVVIIVGVVAGWLAGKLVRGTGFGIIGEHFCRMIGGFIPRPIFAILRESWPSQSSIHSPTPSPTIRA